MIRFNNTKTIPKNITVGDISNGTHFVLSENESKSIYRKTEFRCMYENQSYIFCICYNEGSKEPAVYRVSDSLVCYPLIDVNVDVTISAELS